MNGLLLIGNVVMLLCWISLCSIGRNGRVSMLVIGIIILKVVIVYCFGFNCW